MHQPTEKFIIHQVLVHNQWVECDACEPATPTNPRRRLAVMPDYEIVAKRWQDGNRNTYHSVRLYDISKGCYSLIGERKYTYGYGDHWQLTALELVNEIFPEKFPIEGRSSGHSGIVLRDEWNIACSVTDVDRKRDM